MENLKMKTCRIILSGCSGRLGSAIARLIEARTDCNVVCGIDRCGKADFPIYDSFDKITEDADVIIDTSHHSLTSVLLAFAESKNTPAVICTTGHTEEEDAMIKTVSERVPILKSRNMSLGINLLMDLVRRSAAVLGDDFDIEVIEAHHSKKLDAPSGTALMLADAAKEAREDLEYIYDRHSVRQERDHNEIGIHSVRGGTIVGEHSVIFAGCDEVITLSHSAGSRDLFAAGAIKAALYLAKAEHGFYTMNDVVNSII